MGAEFVDLVPTIVASFIATFIIAAMLMAGEPKE